MESGLAAEATPARRQSFMTWTNRLVKSTSANRHNFVWSRQIWAGRREPAKRGRRADGQALMDLPATNDGVSSQHAASGSCCERRCHARSARACSLLSCRSVPGRFRFGECVMGAATAQARRSISDLCSRQSQRLDYCSYSDHKEKLCDGTCVRPCPVRDLEPQSRIITCNLSKSVSFVCRPCNPRCVCERPKIAVLARV